MDVHTQSNFQEVFVKHMTMRLDLDMNKRLFRGYVDLQIENPMRREKLVLDTKALKIHKAEISSDGGSWFETGFELGKEDMVRGQALSIAIAGDTKVVRVHYETTDKSQGLDWIKKELTADNFPMVVTQFQAINARSFVPCQDTPARKITYDATMRLVSDVTDSRMRIVMAAMEREDIGDRVYKFSMTNPIPTYLIALAAGVFEERTISDRVKVIAEPSMVDKARSEFIDAEKMVTTAESLLGPYAWKRFDIFIMPPSFSYGGMENPTMTFIGPTVVAGDRSLVDVIAHELAHSWSGNFVTNENWNEFWINEGTTMYIERLITGALYGSKERAIDIVLGQEVLKENINEVAKHHGPALTRLKLELTSTFDPDDAVSHIPYEKGFNFWLALEEQYGSTAVVNFLKDYFQNHAFGTMNSQELKSLIVNFPEFKGAKLVDIDDWFYGEAIPHAGLTPFKSSLVDDVNEVVSAMGDKAVFTKTLDRARSFNTKQWSYLLRRAHGASHDIVMMLEKNFGLCDKNDEVKSDFFVLAIRSGLFEVYKDRIDAYIGGVGRIKYIAPVYLALMDSGHKDFAISIYKKYQSKNNHITNGSIARRLEL